MFASDMLQARDLVYKVDERELMIRKRHDAKDRDNFDRDKLWIIYTSRQPTSPLDAGR